MGVLYVLSIVVVIGGSQSPVSSTTAGRELEHVVEYPFGVGKDCEPAERDWKRRMDTGAYRLILGSKDGSAETGVSLPGYAGTR